MKAFVFVSESSEEVVVRDVVCLSESFEELG